MGGGYLFITVVWRSYYSVKLIKFIIVCVYLCCRWETVGSPHRLAWFWLQWLEKHLKQKVTQNYFYLSAFKQATL